MVLEAKIPDISINAKRPPISPPFNLSKFDLIKSIDKKTMVAFREEIFKKMLFFKTEDMNSFQGREQGFVIIFYKKKEMSERRTQ